MFYEYYNHALPKQDFTRNETNSITVSGEGRVAAEPNIAIIVIGVLTESKNLQQAQRENSRTSARVIEAILQQGIKRENIRTTDYRIDNLYDFTDGKQIFRGYEVRHLLETKISDIARIGEVVDAVVAAGANIIYNIRFDTTERKEKYNVALQEAIRIAQTKARTIANTISVHLHPFPFEVTEAQKDIGPIPYQTFTVEKVASTPIEPGMLEIEATVILKYSY